MPPVVSYFAVATVAVYVAGLNPRLASAQQCHQVSTFSEHRASADGNPLRGFFSYIDSATDPFPTSIEFTYFAMKAINTGLSTYDWTVLESALVEVARRSGQLVFRIFLDYPGEPSGIPQYLLTGGLATTSYTSYGGGLSPDYSDASLVSAITELIRNMGRKYDGDNRIAFIQIGFLGFWGEWHTYVDSGPTPAMAPTSTRAAVIEAFQIAFAVTRCVVSADELAFTEGGASPTGDPDIGATIFGWHDDDFGESTCNGQSWGFQGRLTDQNELAHQELAPFGGEVQPSIQQQVFANQGSADSLKSCIDSVKPSWLLFYHLFNSLTADARALGLVVNRQLGYNFVLSFVIVRPLSSCLGLAGDSCALLTIGIRNTGSAPFYYDAFLKAVAAGALAGGKDFASADSTGSALKGLLTRDGIVNHTLSIAWDASQVGAVSFPVFLKVVSAHVLPSQHIRFGMSGIENDGSFKVSVPVTCASFTNTSGVSTSTSSTTLASNDVSQPTFVDSSSKGNALILGVMFAAIGSVILVVVLVAALVWRKKRSQRWAV